MGQRNVDEVNGGSDLAQFLCEDLIIYLASIQVQPAISLQFLKASLILGFRRITE